MRTSEGVDMAATLEVWDDVHAERGALLEFLETLSPSDWDAQTLCTEWRVRDVVGHIIGTTEVSLIKSLPGIAAARFDINRYLAKDGRRRGSAPVPQLIAAFRTAIPRRTTPPRITSVQMLEDIVVHQSDIRRPLGRPRAFPEERVRVVADQLKNDKFYGVPKRIDGLRLVATDMDWSTGEGQDVRGTGEALVMVMAGRPAALDDLSGPGKATLAARF